MRPSIQAQATDRPAAAASTASIVTILADLQAEQDRLEDILLSLSDDAWCAPSGAEGWTIADVVLHLAQTEEAVVSTAAGHDGLSRWGIGQASMDVVVDQMVRTERGNPVEILRRWQRARRASRHALNDADPNVSLPWAAAPLKPATLATTRLAEHWAHGLDVTRPLDIPFPDTARLRHVAWLAYRSLPYAFALAGLAPCPVYCELVAPDGTAWRFGPTDAASVITGSAGAFCRVGARRILADESGLVANGPYGSAALQLLRTYVA
jgi:uncharacterized protein (TIGR03084 family)